MNRFARDANPSSGDIKKISARNHFSGTVRNLVYKRDGEPLRDDEERIALIGLPTRHVKWLRH